MIRDCNVMELAEIKKRIYAMRNGITADVLRRSGAPYRMIFGVNVPHLAEIARDLGHSADVAEMLWRDTGVRESLMLATMVYPPEEMDADKARKWLAQAPTAEVVDLLCHRIIRHRPFAGTLAMELSDAEQDMMRYAALRIYFNLLPVHQTEAKAVAERELQRQCKLTAQIASSLVDEIAFLTEEA